jgi:hypothetical protein
MSTPLTDAELAAIQARCDEAEGGWHLVEDPDDVYRLEIHGDGPTLVAVFGGDPDNGSASYPTRENALFAAHARHDVPALLAEVRRLQLQVTVMSFNAAHPVGTPVMAYPGCRPELDPDGQLGRRMKTRTRTTAWLANGHTPVVMVEDYSSWIALTHVDAITTVTS